MPQDRRTFLKTAGIAAAITSAAPLGLTMQNGPAGGPSTAAAAPRASVAGKFALELDGTVVGFLSSFTGGFPFGKVLEFADGGDDGPTNKTIAGVGYDDITIEVALGMDPIFWDWIEGMVAGAPQSRSGAIRFLDFQNEAHSRLDFYGALITEVTIPAADAASKDPATMTIVLSPESTEYLPDSGKVNPPSAARQKQWLPSNFRLKVDGLPTTKVSKVESFTLKQKIIESTSGEERIPQKTPGKLEYPNLTFYVPGIDSQPWFDFFDDFVLQGNAQPEDELDGSLEFLSPDLKSVLLELTFSHMGIFKLALEKPDAAQAAAGRFVAEMYVEQMTLQVSP